MKAYLVISLLISLVMVVFSVQNAQSVKISFMTWFIESPLAVILLVTFSAGVLTAFLASIPSRIRLGNELNKLKSKQSENRSLTVETL